jgi:hypothetical protein
VQFTGREREAFQPSGCLKCFQQRKAGDASHIYFYFSGMK